MDNHNHAPAQPEDAAPEGSPDMQAEAGRGAEPDAADHAARSVMHPDWHDTDWRYYFGAWGG